MMEGKTNGGFEYTLTDNRLNDWETLEAIIELETDQSKIVEVARRLLGQEQYYALKESVRDENGKVSVTTMTEEINYILNTPQVKKS